IPTRLGSSVSSDGILQTDEDPGPLRLADTLTATHGDAYGQSSATASTLGSRLALVDAAGNDADSYPTGGVVYVQLEDHNANNPGQFDVVMGNISSSIGDVETVYLQETGKNTALFTSTVGLHDSATPIPTSGLLEAQAGSNISVDYTEVGGGYAYDNAQITANAVEFFGEAGLPTSELLENTVARVRAVSVADNADPGTPETIAVAVDSFYAADAESLVLTETGADTGVFEGQIALLFIDPPSSAGIPGNGVL
ncbi:MAG: hypothetical protein GY938_29400, partial [Ketobacter sp.]|nr:hypothetical protein [Ketobacter sp.]